MLGLLVASPEGGAREMVVEIRSGDGLCSGAFVGPREVVTAYHCVVSRRRIDVRDAGGRRWKARRVHVDRDADLALLEVDGNGISTPLEVRKDRLVVGEGVEVWGHPLASVADGVPQLSGLLYHSRFAGTVSAVGPGLTQLDVAFNPGVSGGPVLDAEQRIAGVASRKLKGEHLSFSSPVWEFWASRDLDPQHHWVSGRLNVRVELDLPTHLSGLPSLHIVPQLALWDWVIVEAGLGTGLGQTREALNRGQVDWRSARGATLGRLRMGVGPQSLSLELGPAVSMRRSLELAVSDEGVRMVPRQEALSVQAVARMNWRGWSLGVHWDPAEQSWAMQMGARLLTNVMLF